MVDYVRLAATAVRLVTKNGTLVEFQRLDGAAPDPDQPWNGPATTPVAQTATTMAIFVHPSAADQFGIRIDVADLTARFSELVIAVPINPADNPALDTFQLVRRVGQSTRKISVIQKLRPAEITLLYYFGIAR
jgi:hypothetical protein